MSSYNLTDNVQDAFPFSIRGKKYEMRYPRTAELEEINQLNVRMDELSKNTSRTKKEEEEFKRISDQLVDAMYAFIKPVDHDTPIKDALMNENIKVLKNFNFMIKTELSV